MKKKVLLLDTMAIIHRAYFALPPFKSPSGKNTGAIYGLLTTLIKCLKDIEPQYVVSCFDTPEKTNRAKEVEEYKANRVEAEDDLVEQIKESYTFFEKLNIPHLEKSGYEADDIIGTLAEKYKDEFEVHIVTGDNDLLQLVEDKKVFVHITKTGSNFIKYDEKKVFEKYGFKKDQLVDYKGLSGDASDNIKGVSSVGDKTAKKILDEFFSIDEMYSALKKNENALVEKGFTKRIQDIVLNEEEMARTSKSLATIQRDVKVMTPNLSTPWKETVDTGLVEEYFNSLGFNSVSKRFFDVSGITFGSVEVSSEDDDLLKRAKIALSLLESEYTNPKIDDILHFSKKDNLKDAYSFLVDKLKEVGDLHLLKDIEEPLIPVLEDMSKNGVLVDKEELEKLSKKVDKKLEILSKEIYSLSGIQFNINSPKQLGEILFDKLEIKSKKKTAKGSRSTKEEVLKSLVGEHDIVEKLLEYRHFNKLKTTYIDVYKNILKTEKDGRIHTTFLQTGTETGRMSSKDPNMQNIPQEMRCVFISSSGKKLLSFDYSQIELRIAAILSEDKSLSEIFKDGKDVHEEVAVKLLKRKEVSKEDRTKAKAINFGILYGMGAKALQKSIGGDLESAREYISNYKETFKQLTEYLESIIGFVRKNGYTETMFGRKRYISHINSSIPYLQATAERVAINAPIQGTSADFIKIAMKNIYNELEKEGLLEKAKMLLQIHDELLFEVDDSAVDQVSEIVERGMVSVVDSDIPIVVNKKVGERWGDI